MLAREEIPVCDLLVQAVDFDHSSLEIGHPVYQHRGFARVPGEEGHHVVDGRFHGEDRSGHEEPRGKPRSAYGLPRAGGIGASKTPLCSSVFSDRSALAKAREKFLQAYLLPSLVGGVRASPGH